MLLRSDVRQQVIIKVRTRYKISEKEAHVTGYFIFVDLNRHASLHYLLIQIFKSCFMRTIIMAGL